MKYLTKTKLDVFALNYEGYDPLLVINWMKERLNIKTDRGLAFALNMTPTHMSKMRHRKTGLSAEIMLAFHEATNYTVSFNEIRRVAGLPLFFPNPEEK